MGDAPKADESAKYRYGLVVVLAGFAVILAAYLFSLNEYDKAADVSTALAPITGVIGTVVGAYFGIQVGSAGKDKAEDARAKADEQTKKALLALPPEQARQIEDLF